MIIKSNIPKVIERLERLKAQWPEVLRRAIAPERWAAELKAQAQFALEGEGAAATMVSDFLELMGSAFFGNKSQWWMSGPVVSDNETPDFKAAGEVAQRAPSRPIPGDMVDMLDRGTLEEARQYIKEWVMAGAAGVVEGKDLKGDDEVLVQQTGRYDNLLVERIWRVFGIHPDYLGHIGDKYGNIDKQEAAIEGLSRHITAYFATLPGGGMDGGTVDLWLRKVLEAWTQHMVVNLPLVIQEEMAKMKAA